jgi:hypothetical protein
MVATMLGNCFLSAAAVYLIADVGKRQQVADLRRSPESGRGGR